MVDAIERQIESLKSRRKNIKDQVGKMRYEVRMMDRQRNRENEMWAGVSRIRKWSAA